ncbi:MAG: phosphoribosylformylglycinamidine cyclo-ligase [Candidatus Aminicenantes bacterium]|nr:phosphoribosylformylglycinamidine cyclo-ligase [Acidobacteriota bacterium]MCG2810587.1 phosphoribosylformylglycinamidine cyclo-ligase [Candidatus Aminicenantes bacterium]
MKKSAYEQAGVSINRGNEAVKRIKSMVGRLGVQEIGKFGGFFPLKGGIKNPILVSSADGVGTKLKIAFMTGVHNTVGRDLVNHCVNDILVSGARPLFFLDYLASGRVEPGIVSEVISGVLDGCLENEMVLLGGETAEMPGFYQEGEYDIAGFIVGIVGRENVVDGKTIRKGDLLVGLPSTGLHTNGYSLARHIVFEKLNLKTSSKVSELEAPIAEELLRVHRSYLKPVQTLLEGKLLKGMAHITGGGLLENIPRILPEETAVVIEKAWPVPPLFSFLVQAGNVSEAERYRVFNMGIGMVLVIEPRNLSRVEFALNRMNEDFYLIGQVIENKGGVRVRIK